MARKNEEKEPTRLEQLFRMRADRDGGTHFTDPEFEEKYPALFYFLNEIHVGDKLTERANIKLSNDGGDVYLALQQPGAGMVCEVLATTVVEAFTSLEAKVALGSGAWRFWTKHTPVLKPNGKKPEKE